MSEFMKNFRLFYAKNIVEILEYLIVQLFRMLEVDFL